MNNPTRTSIKAKLARIFPDKKIDPEELRQKTKYGALTQEFIQANPVWLNVISPILIRMRQEAIYKLSNPQTVDIASSATLQTIDRLQNELLKIIADGRDADKQLQKQESKNVRTAKH